MHAPRHALAALVASVPLWAAAAPSYVAHVLVDPQGRMLKGDAINEAGYVAGATNAASHHGPIEAMVRGPGFFEQGAVAGSSNSEAYGIDASGDVAGFSMFGGRSHAFLRAGGPPVALLDDSLSSVATAMSPSGLVAGYANADGQEPRGFLWQAGSITWLDAPGPGGASYAWGVNDDGVVVGQVSVAGGLTSHAARWQGGTMTRLGGLDGNTGFSIALSVNASGTAVGSCALSPNVDHACAWGPDGVAVDLGALQGGSSTAWSVNAAGVVVGDSSMSGIAGIVAVLFRPSGPVDLNSLVTLPQGVVLISASAVNDRGQIVVRGSGPNGFARNFVLDPVAAR